jgi:hypothetical protein
MKKMSLLSKYELHHSLIANTQLTFKLAKFDKIAMQE